MTTPAVVVFDVNGTLSDPSPLARRLSELGAPELTAELWFASLLRDGFALAAAGTSGGFVRIGAGVLRSILTTVPTLTTDVETAVEEVLRCFSDLPVHADVAEGIDRLADTGVRLVTLSNGSADVADRLLSTAGLRSRFERLLSVEDAGVWKPAPAAYAHAAASCGVTLADLLLVAVHPWDIDGAARAGLRTAWVDRQGVPYPDTFRPPEHTVSSMRELAALVR